MANLKNKRCVGYCRVSSESQIDNTSLDLQVEKIKSYCKTYDIRIDKIFVEEGESGSTIDAKQRKEYNQMLDYIKSNEVDAIVVLKVDRIHRSGKNLLVMVEDVLEPLSVSFISITEQFDTGTAQGKLFLTMLGGFAEFERRMINDRTKSGRLAKAKKDKYAGGRVPFGYELIDSDRLEVDELEAKTVQTIFEMRKEGKALNKIVTYLNDNDIKINDKPFSNSKIEYILANEVYTGTYTYDGDKENNNITFKVPKIISRQLYNIINKQESK